MTCGVLVSLQRQKFFFDGKLFGPSLAAFGGFSNLFFSAFFSFVRFKKSSKPFALWEEIAQSFQTDTRAVVVSQKKKTSLFYSVFTQILSRLKVLNTQNKST